MLAGALVLKVVAATLFSYRDYFPPNFSADFLRGRERHFFGPYQWAFSTHIASGPVSLVVGLWLVSERARSLSPRWHRRLGRFQVACVLLLVTPSGLGMAYYAAAGPVAAVGLASLAVATATFTSLGAVAASARRFADHRRWMWRSYLMLCSAVVLRMMGGLASILGVTSPWFDPLATWACWLVPLAAFEVREWGRRRSPRSRRPSARGRRELPCVGREGFVP